MSQPPFPARSGALGASTDPHSRSAQTAWTVRRLRPTDPIAPRSHHPLRRYDIQWLNARGDLEDRILSAPALPIFEAAYNAFARGAIIPTRHGPVAVEDLLPGDEVETSDGRFEPVVWIGSMPLDTKGRRSDKAQPERLYRVMADTFGFGRPAPDVMLGGGARLLLRADSLKSYLGTDSALAPIPHLTDGVSIVEVAPISTVRTYHCALARHAVLRVNGLEVESYHPGVAASGQLPGDLRGLSMEMFPHLGTLGDFGALAHARLTPTEMLGLLSA